MPAAVMDGEAAVELAAVPEPPQGAERYVVVKQEVELELDFRDQSISGVSTIQLFLIDTTIEEVSFDARQCEIDVENVTVDGYKTKASFSDPHDLMQAPPEWQLGVANHHVMMKRMRPLRPENRPEVPITEREKLFCCVPADRSLRVTLPDGEGLFKDEPRRPLKIKTAKADKDASLDRPDPQDEKNNVKISIPFRSKMIRDGLHFVGVAEGDSRYPHVYTRHSIEPGTASCIFPCVDDPSSRNPWKISIKCPRTLSDVFAEPKPATALPASDSRKRKFGELASTPARPQPPRPALVEEDKLREMTVVCSGNLTGEQIDPKDERKKIMTFDCQIAAAQHIAFAVGPFEHIDLCSEFRTEEADEKLGANAAKIHAYCLPGRGDEVRHTCAPIVAAADYFAPEFGKYPFESYKICFLEDMVSDTGAAASMSLCSTRLLYPEDIIDPDLDVTMKLVHALATQYFGVHIVPNQRSDYWLIVGIQWLMTFCFLRVLCGNNWYRFHLKNMADRLVAADVNRPSLYDMGKYLEIGEFELDFLALKAPLVLHILDQRLSKVPGSTGIMRVISSIVSNANISSFELLKTCLSSDQFRQSCEKKSQYRPDELWEQWVKRSGCPKMLVKQRFNKKNLNVDIIITQTQEPAAPKPINRDDFWREFQEQIHHVEPGEVPQLFTGPFTIRIHEADGTPYEHYLSITDRDRQGTTLSIAYNTKYKRLKRTKKAQAAATNNTTIDKHDVQDDDVIYFNMLGDVLQSQQDFNNWGLQDWPPQVQTQMDGESYEWIRFDCNFEWICETLTDMPGYMYLAQLQQDRDVIAHQDAMLFFKRGKRHGVASTIETRTVMDRRYYHGIRTMAVEDLTKQADPDLNYIGLAQLILSFRHYFCEKIVGKNGGVTFPPTPNDFQDKAQYAVQSAIPGAIARTRERGRCSKNGRNFLLDLLLFNDNSENEYSDQFYIAKLLDALTTSLIPEKLETDGDLLSNLKVEDDEDLEFKRFIEKTIEEIDKYRRMDEWTSTYQNIWTTTALNCKMRLMKAHVIPTSPLEFVQYLQDDNIDLVRIKGFECLVELGMLAKGPIMKLLLSYLSTDPSPFVRDQLFKIFCKGVAGIAFGETKLIAEPKKEAEVDESGLIIEQGEAEVLQRKLDAVRRDDITQALMALKHELKTEESKKNPELAVAIWKAVESNIIGVREKFQLLELCSAMFEPEDSLLLTVKYPRVWKCTRDPLEFSVAVPEARPSKKQCVIRFTPGFRTEPRKPHIEFRPPEPPSSEVKQETKKIVNIKLNSAKSFSGGSASGPPTPSPLVRKDSISVTIARPAASPAPAASSAVPRGGSDSIAVQPAAWVAKPMAMSPPLIPALPSSQQVNGSTPRPSEKPIKVQNKRKSDNTGEISDRPKKSIKSDSSGTARPVANGRPQRIVTVRFTLWEKLPESIQKEIYSKHKRNTSASSSSIVATPAGKAAQRLSKSHRSASPSPGPGTATPSSQFSASSTKMGTSSSVKQRKPLPSSAPHLSSPASVPSVPNRPPAPATPAAPPKTIIKIIKIKPPSRPNPATK
ncbi:hypothetical protein B0H63DRAFT_53908 [Podospora didyma]|uniref:Transcription initiation factor TFIID subunit 2 n=1 Tax=Podospora didyma TaxID=330526 RepID=A0AAE0P7A8_9PEZI|nr:hypothetical protein B0H63DRAFT_53908 [Podospora didyma]